MQKFWQSNRVLITGSTGFVGSHLIAALKKIQAKHVTTTSLPSDNLLDRKNCLRVTKNKDIVVHLAGNVGGIGKNQEVPGTLFYENAVMGIELMEAARINKVKKFVTIGTVCEYPKFTPIPFHEKNLWDGYPEETNAPYGLAKKMLLVQAQAYRKQYGFNAVHLIPVNLFGPGDNFDPSSSHVIPALIHKFLLAKKTNLPNVTLWGNWSATREFMYVEDAVRAIILATERYNDPEPVNIGANYEIDIAKLARLISKLVGYKGKIKWDRSKPNGQPRRRLSVMKARQEFGFTAKIGLEQGLKKTIKWYEQAQK